MVQMVRSVSLFNERFRKKTVNFFSKNALGNIYSIYRPPKVKQPAKAVDSLSIYELFDTIDVDVVHMRISTGTKRIDRTL